MQRKTSLTILLLLSVPLLFTGCASDSEAKLAELEARISQAEAAVSGETQSHNSKDEQLSQKTEENERLAEQNDRLREEIKQLERELQDKSGQIAEMEAIMDEKDSIISDQAQNTMRLIDRNDEAGSYYNEQDLLWWLVVKFDEGWIRYINAGDETVFKYVVKDSPIYNMAFNYRRNNSRLKQLMLNIGNSYVEVYGNTAKIHVFELLEEIDSNGFSETKEYDWVYSAEKIDNVWYLTEMVRDN